MDKPFVTKEVMLATQEDVGRLEAAVKDLTAAVKDVILIDERQKVQGQRIGDLETQVGVLNKTVEDNKITAAKEVAALEKVVASWINRTIGAWFVLGIFGSAVIAFAEFVHK